MTLGTNLTTIIKNSQRGLRLLFRMLRRSTIFILGCSLNYVRALIP